MMKEVGTHAIKTERLLLRRFVESDIKPYYDNYGCDQAVQEYIAWFDCKTLDDTEDFVHEHLKKYDDPYFFGWVIEYEGEVIGSIGCFNVNPSIIFQFSNHPVCFVPCRFSFHIFPYNICCL